MRILAALVLAFGAALGLRAQVLETKTYATSGHPSSSVFTPDGKFVLLTVNGRGSAGVEVYRVEGTALKKVAFQKLNGSDAQGIVLIPKSRMLAVGLSNDGVAFLSLDATLEGKSEVKVLPQGERSGSGYLAVAPDGQTLFVANEYGEGGNVGVIALHRDAAGALHPVNTQKMPAGRATPGVAISPDGSRLYAAGEILRADIAATSAMHNVPELRHGGCVQGKGNPQPNGGLYVMDAEVLGKLTAESTEDERRSAGLRRVNAGCSPVRMVVSADGSRLYVTARGDDRVLEFDTAKLDDDVTHAFVRAMPSGGTAPVGLALFDGGKRLLVANSNRFAGGAGSAAVLNLGNGAVEQTIKTGAFPRNITASADGKMLLLSVFSGDELMVLTMK